MTYSSQPIRCRANSSGDNIGAGSLRRPSDSQTFAPRQYSLFNTSHIQTETLRQVNDREKKDEAFDEEGYCHEDNLDLQFHDVGDAPNNARRQGAQVQEKRVDRSFRIDDVVAGTYELIVQALDARNGRVIAAAARTLVVPEMPGGRSDQPLDLGTLEMLSVP
jgi:hypothetical protein